MKSNDKIIEEFRKKTIGSLSRIQVEMMNNYGGSGIEDEDEKLIEKEANNIVALFTQALEQKEREVREKALNDFFQAVDARYKDFEITQAMGKILQNLKQPKE